MGSFEISGAATDQHQISNVYRQAGLEGDYFDLKHIPWPKMRVNEACEGNTDTTPPQISGQRAHGEAASPGAGAGAGAARRHGRG